MSEQPRARKLLTGLRRPVPARRGRPPAAVDAHYAGILDGRRLWLALPLDVPAPALWSREVGLFSPVDEHEDDPHAPSGLRSVRWDLESALAQHGPGTYAVVVPTPEGRRPVRLPTALPEDLAAAVPLRGRTMQLRLVRSEAGDLAVDHDVPPPTVDLVSAAYADGTVHLVLDAPAGCSGEVTLVDESDEVAGVLRGEHRTDGLHCSLTADDVPAAPGPFRFVAGGLPVVRRDNGLTDARQVLLPFVPGPVGDDVVAQLAFRPHGRLVLRRTAPVTGGAA
ncbi:hypothetical protein AB3X52_02470 [Nocardioides sp. DS6]|uniref:Uncharacterized protein n=1 Tax=Nocardioides eburneus TaxID=3231482 RepID=A0ABV3SVH5_9ACTN